MCLIDDFKITNTLSYLGSQEEWIHPNFPKILVTVSPYPTADISGKKQSLFFLLEQGDDYIFASGVEQKLQVVLKISLQFSYRHELVTQVSSHLILNLSYMAYYPPASLVYVTGLCGFPANFFWEVAGQCFHRRNFFVHRCILCSKTSVIEDISLLDIPAL